MSCRFVMRIGGYSRRFRWRRWPSGQVICRHSGRVPGPIICTGRRHRCGCCCWRCRVGVSSMANAPSIAPTDWSASRCFLYSWPVARRSSSAWPSDTSRPPHHSIGFIRRASPGSISSPSPGWPSSISRRFAIAASWANIRLICWPRRSSCCRRSSVGWRRSRWGSSQACRTSSIGCTWASITAISPPR